MPRVALLAAIALVLGACGAPRCRNQVVRRIVAPDNKRDAVIYHRSCGKGEGASTEVALLPHDADLPDLPTTVLSLADSVAIASEWQGPARILLMYPERAKLVSTVGQSDGITVVALSRR